MWGPSDGPLTIFPALLDVFPGSRDRFPIPRGVGGGCLPGLILGGENSCPKTGRFLSSCPGKVCQLGSVLDIISLKAKTSLRFVNCDGIPIDQVEFSFFPGGPPKQVSLILSIALVIFARSLWICIAWFSMILKVALIRVVLPTMLR